MFITGYIYRHVSKIFTLFWQCTVVTFRRLIVFFVLFPFFFFLKHSERSCSSVCPNRTTITIFGTGIFGMGSQCFQDFDCEFQESDVSNFVGGNYTQTNNQRQALGLPTKEQTDRPTHRSQTDRQTEADCQLDKQAGSGTT